MADSPDLREGWWDTNCEIHGTHWPRIHSTHKHHVLPLAWGGTKTPDNEVNGCPTGHESVHLLLNLMATVDGAVSPERFVGFSRGEVQLAKEGFAKWIAAGRPRRLDID